MNQMLSYIVLLIQLSIKQKDNPELCMNINVNGTKYLVESAEKIGAKFVYISTDYVFDGNKKDRI